MFCGSPRSFGLNPKCSHTSAVDFSLETYSIVIYSSLSLPLLLSGLHAALCDAPGAPPPHTETEWLTGGFTPHYAEESVQTDAAKWTHHPVSLVNEKLSSPANLSSSFLIIVQLIDLLIITTGRAPSSNLDVYFWLKKPQNIQVFKTFWINNS